MSDQLDEQLAQVGLTLLAATGVPVVDDDEIAAATTPPYMRVYTSIERPAGAPGNALRGRSTTWTVRWYVHHVGADDTAARALAMQSRTALLDKRPSVAGRNCSLIRQDAAQPPRREEGSGQLTIDLVVVYRMTSTG